MLMSCSATIDRTKILACTKKPLVNHGELVKVGQVLADGSATEGGELALGQNVPGGLHALGRLQLRGCDS